jgi:hypothetical protein
MSSRSPALHRLSSPQNERRFQGIGDVDKTNEQRDIVSKEIPLSESILQHHQTVLSYIGSFECPGCGKIYRWKQSMVSHYRNECGKEPQFRCPLCPYKCKQKGNLKSHVRLWHPQSLNDIFKWTWVMLVIMNLRVKMVVKGVVWDSVDWINLTQVRDY